MNKIFVTFFSIVASCLFFTCEQDFLDLTKGGVTINEVNGSRSRESFIVVAAESKVYHVGDNIYDGTEFGANGNKNNAFEPGETIGYILKVRNVGGRKAMGVNAVISTADPWVTNLQNTEHYISFIESDGWRPSASIGSSWSRGDNLLISIRNNTPRGHRLNFNIAISDANGNSWNDYFIIIVN